MFLLVAMLAIMIVESSGIRKVSVKRLGNDATTFLAGSARN
jgi:hypothetical protein